MKLLTSIAILAVAAFATGCKDFNAPKEKDSGPSADGGPGGAGAPVTGFDGGIIDGGPFKTAGPDAAADGSAAAGKPALKNDFVVAQSSDSFIFVPNPENHVVTVIDPVSMDARDIPAGNRPIYLAVEPGSNTALAIDVESNRITVIRVSRSAQTTKSMDAVQGANAIAFSPNGRYAVVYYSPDFVGGEEPAGGYQEIAVVSLEKGNEWSKRITVGLRPRQIVFSADVTRLFLVTDSGVSVISLDKLSKSGPSIADTYDFGHGVDAGKLRIKLTRWGRYAVGFKPNDSNLYLLETTSGKTYALDTVALLNWRPDAGAPPEEDSGARVAVDAGHPLPVLPSGEMPAISDIILTAPGGSNCALVALPKQNAVLRVPLPDGFDSPSSVTTVYKNERDDSLAISPESSPSGPTSLLFDRSGFAPRVTLLRLAGDKLVKTIRLAGPINTVQFAEGADIALLTHDQNGSLAANRVVGYSVLALGTPFANFRATTRPPGPVAFSQKADALFLIVRDDAASVSELHRVAFDSLSVDVIKLEDKPRAVGVLSEVERVFVDQEHSDGRITLFDWKGQKTGSLSGFLLTDRVRE